MSEKIRMIKGQAKARDTRAREVMEESTFIHKLQGETKRRVAGTRTQRTDRRRESDKTPSVRERQRDRRGTTRKKVKRTSDNN